MLKRNHLGRNNMDNDDYREVDFHKYCETCEYKEVEEVEDPCNECLDEFYNEYTDKPVKWKEKSAK